MTVLSVSFTLAGSGLVWFGWRKQVDGVVAHLVHSLDAAHMMLTVNRLHSYGLRHFAMVHDSFGVHAGDVDLLNRVLREEFVGMYSELVMANFFMEVLKSSPVGLPSLPTSSISWLGVKRRNETRKSGTPLNALSPRFPYLS